jgi:hypothetical protein
MKRPDIIQKTNATAIARNGSDHMIARATIRPLTRGRRGITGMGGTPGFSAGSRFCPSTLYMVCRVARTVN